MKVLFIPWGLTPHYFPMVPLAWACRTAGHEVRVAGHPHIVDVITGSGMTAFPVGGSVDHVQMMRERAPEALGYLRERQLGQEFSADEQEQFVYRMNKLMGEQYVRSAEATVDDLVAFARGWQPDIVVGDPLMLSAPLVAKAVGVPLVFHLWGDILATAFGFPGIALSKGPWEADLGRLYDRFDVELGVVHAEYTIDTCPDFLQSPGIANRVPVRYIPYNGTGVIPEWLSRPAGRPRVCVIRGTTTAQLGGAIIEVLPEILAGLADLDVDVVLAVKESDRAMLGEMPPNVRVIAELPLNLLLPTCDAIVHHGGAGTMLTAATYGVPHVAIPEIPDQMANSAALSFAGVGIALSEDEAKAATIRSATAEVLAEGPVRAAARRLQADMLAQPAPSEMVATLEKTI